MRFSHAQKPRIRVLEFLSSPFSLVCMGVLIGFFCWVSFREYQQIAAFHEQLEALQYEQRQAEQRTEDLVRVQEQFKEPAFLEKIARERQHMKGAGERVAIIHYPDASQPDVPSSSVPDTLKEGEKENASRWMEMIIDNRPITRD